MYMYMYVNTNTEIQLPNVDLEKSLYNVIFTQMYMYTVSYGMLCV